jgi:hypothetical protein
MLKNSNKLNQMVKIVKNSKNDLVFTPNEKASKDGKMLGFYLVETIELKMEGGFIKENRVTALLTTEVALASKLAWKEGHELEGKIITVESFEPFYEGQPCKINPTSKDAILVDGKKVYRDNKFTADLKAVNSYIVASKAVQAPVTNETQPLTISSGTALNK